MQMQCLIPCSAAGTVIGRAGSVIQKLSEQTNCRMQMSDNVDVFNTKERVMTFTAPLLHNAPAPPLEPITHGIKAVFEQMLTDIKNFEYQHKYARVTSTGQGQGHAPGMPFHEGGNLQYGGDANPPRHMMPGNGPPGSSQYRQQQQHSVGGGRDGYPQHGQQQQYNYPPGSQGQHGGQYPNSGGYGYNQGRGHGQGVMHMAQRGHGQMHQQQPNKGGSGLVGQHVNGRFGNEGSGGRGDVFSTGGNAMAHNIPFPSAQVTQAQNPFLASNSVTANDVAVPISVGPPGSMRASGNVATSGGISVTTDLTPAPEVVIDAAKLKAEVEACMTPHVLNALDDNSSRLVMSFGLEDRMVGSILGRQGVVIRELMSCTGTVINIAPKGTFVEGTSLREVKVLGTLEQIQAANTSILDKIVSAVRSQHIYEMQAAYQQQQAELIEKHQVLVQQIGSPQQHEQLQQSALQVQQLQQQILQKQINVAQQQQQLAVLPLPSPQILQQLQEQDQQLFTAPTLEEQILIQQTQSQQQQQEQQQQQFQPPL